jgi:hypothetical protein
VLLEIYINMVRQAKVSANCRNVIIYLSFFKCVFCRLAYFLSCYSFTADNSAFCRGVDISRANYVKNEVMHRVKGERNIARKIKPRKANWIRHILRKNYILNTLLEER